MRNNVKSIIFIGLLLGIGIICLSINLFNHKETLHSLLKKEENSILNTTEEKNGEIPYQIVDGILYYGDEGFCQYKYSTKESKILRKGFMPKDFLIVGKKVYCTEINNSSEEGNDWDIISRSLENLDAKEVLIERVSDYVFTLDSVIFLRYEGDKRNVYKYVMDESTCTKVVSISDELSEDKRLQELKFAIGSFLVFLGETSNGYIIVYDMETKLWNTYFFIDFCEKNLFYKILDVQAANGNIYIQGVVCDRNKSSIAGPYVVKKAKENGTWQVDIRTGEMKKITNNVYYEGIYILNNSLYGIDSRKCEVISTFD